MTKKRIFIDGAEGTTGLDIRDRLAALHDSCDVITLPDEIRKDRKHRYVNLNDCDVAILCLPDDAAREAVAMVENEQVKILDCSTAHRVARGWVYGLPEYNDKQSELIAKAKRVANPGCYPTGFILLVAPLKRMGLIPDDYPMTVFGISGYSGGGKTMIADYESRDKNMNGHVYGLGQTHKHLAEMGDYGLLPHPPMFQPVVGKFARGMVVMVPLDGRVLKAVDKKTIEKIWAESYRGCEKILLDNGGATPVNINSDRANISPDEFANRDDILLQVFGDEKTNCLTLYATFDNLGKGASGAALQNVRLMLGL